MTRPRYGRGVLGTELPRALRRLDPPPSSVFVLQDRRARAVTDAALERTLGRLDAPVKFLRWPAAERRKVLSEAETLARRIVRGGADRRSLILAVGGGVTTDMGGFLAAMLLRGVRWGAVPTTLLAMADAALGGKTAVDLPEGKNLLGAFHHPAFVLCDVATLATLPAREWLCGLGEVLKSAMVADPPMLRRLEAARPGDTRRPSAVSLDLARRSGRVKMRIVERDPLEKGERKLLNLGHTFGHALEAAAGFRRLAHGEAVALGLLCALRMAEEQGLAAPDYGARIGSLAKRLGLPTRYPGPLPARRELAKLLRRDKKARSGSLELILPVEPGACRRVTGVAPAAAAAVIERALRPA